jgi:N-acylneuraminate cytidylyltransferase/CMP-N,N'-diacetyllegionaminic acid synthase
VNGVEDRWKKKYEVLGIIPARCNSKRVINKNIRKLNGKPLIAYTIEAALKAKSLTRVIVSTDSEEIADLSKSLGAEVPFLRPCELAQDSTPMLAVLQHAVESLEQKENYKIDIIMILQPTSPLRKSCHIDEAVRKLIDTDADSVVSLCEVEHSPYWMKKIKGDKVFDFIEGSEKYTRKQDLPKVHRLNGAIYVTRYKALVEENRLLGDNTRAIIMNQEDSIDIDTELDFKLAELVLKERHICGKNKNW